ncbi:MAG: alkaline phosphatase D family protein [Planctomycetota bacterium]
MPPSHSFTLCSRNAALLLGCLLSSLGPSILAQQPAAEQPSAAISRISFGSCAKQDQPQPIWEAIVAGKPDLFLLLGDNIYGDTNDMQLLRKKYRQLEEQPGFVKLRAICPVLATWDDHDFGRDDSGAEFELRKESQQVFLDFIQARPDDPRRQREGIYSASIHGPPGRRVQLILLDARYFRSPLKKGFSSREPGEGYRGRYVPNDDPQATVLGDDQWQWLEDQLQQPAEVRIIGSSYQVLSNQHGWEMWGNFPLERQRLFALIRKTRAKGVLMISGDRHLAELAALPADAAEGVGYPLCEATSSSLNQPSGNFTKTGVRFANEINPYRLGLTWFDVNYGNILIDWDSPDPVIRMQICDEQGTVVLQQRIQLSQLQ